MARASTQTLLSLDRFSQILGIPPAHFNGGYAPSLDPAVWPISGCSSIWTQNPWQSSDQVSREDIARAIYEAEQDLMRELGYSLAPQWVAQEVHRWPRHHRPDIWNSGGLNNRGQLLSVRARRGKVIAGGRRATTVIEAGASVAYSDPDGDGFSELATITAATTLTDECEIKLYFAGKSADPTWEIRPVKSKSISGGTITFTVDSWQLIDPDLWDDLPTSNGFSAIDISTTSNFVSTVDVYREYNDTTAVNSQLLWEPEPRNTIAFATCTACGGTGCPACELTVQDGCLAVRDAEPGIVVPTPATYDADDEQWTQDSWTVCREPDQVKIWYYAGLYSESWLRGDTCDPLSEYWAQIIARLATARLERPFCACGNAVALSEHLRDDLALVNAERSYALGFDVLDNPFGTRRGEVEAWQRVRRLEDTVMVGAAL